MATEALRVTVAGGGVIGLSVARALALRGAAVTVVDERRAAGAASWAAAGMLSPLAETGDAGALHVLADASLDLFPDFVRTVEAAAGALVEYRTCGKLHVAMHDGDAADLRHLAGLSVATRFGIEELDGDAARRLEPALGDAVRGALLVRRDHRVDNRRLHDALRAALPVWGIRQQHGRVARIDSAGGRVTGVRLAGGAVIDANAVVLAAGAWSGGGIDGIDLPPVRPVRGQMLAVKGDAPLFERVVATPRCYMIPRDDGRLLIGATVEEVGFTEGMTEHALGALHASALELSPRIGELNIVETWFGFRPGTPDGLPILGADERMAGLHHASGHYRNGILLAPITAELVAASVFGDTPAIALEPFSVDRFRG